MIIDLINVVHQLSMINPYQDKCNDVMHANTLCSIGPIRVGTVVRTQLELG